MSPCTGNGGPQHRVRRGLAAVVLIGAALAALIPAAARAQTPSTLDTIRIVNATTALGDTFDLDIYLRNVDTLGAYNLRIRYDHSIIEPLTDTTITGVDTTISAEAAIQMRGTAFETFAAGLPSTGVLTFVAVDFDLNPATLFLPGSGVAARMRWRVRPGVTPQTTSITFENDPTFPSSFNTFSDYTARIFKRPVLTPGVVTIQDTLVGPPGNHAPVLPQPTTPLSVNQGELLTFGVSATDQDNDSLRLLAFNLPSGATFTPSNPARGLTSVTGTFRWTPSFAQQGSYVVSFQATDAPGAQSPVRNVTINVAQVPTDRLFTTSVAGQDPQGGVPGATGVVVPVNLVSTQTTYGVQFDFVYNPSVFVPSLLQPTDRLAGFSVYQNLGSTPGRLRAVAFNVSGSPIVAGTSTVLFNVIGSMAVGAAAGSYDLKFENAWESINPDPNVASVRLNSENGIILVDSHGDANLDSRIDVGDAVAVVGYILQSHTFTSRQFGAADMNADNLVDVFDLVAIVNLIMGAPAVYTAPALTPAQVNLVYNPADGSNGAYRLAASVPTDVAGAQIEVDYDPALVSFGEPERLPASSGLNLEYRDDGQGRLVALLYYNPVDPNSRIRSGPVDILRIPLVSRSAEQTAARLTVVKLSDPSAQPIAVAGFSPLPRDFELDQNYPNPFNAGTTISFSIAGSSAAHADMISTRLDIYNIMGQKVTTLYEGRLGPGRHALTWDATDHNGAIVASGLYFYRLTAGGRSETKKMVLMK